MAKKSKKQMLEEMKEGGWMLGCSEKDSYEDVKEEYDIFLDETGSDIDMFPNGRDYEAEDEDGPF